MTKDHKYVYNGFDYDEMYDLKNDPHEMVEQGTGYGYGNDVAWPLLPSDLSEVRRDLLQRVPEIGR